ncbi:MAG TPA: hypothetical protein VLN59_16795, partial [Burkholderiales bacterium]|nr:hypothetical protein [Burkholderiales bacterium]
ARRRHHHLPARRRDNTAAEKASFTLAFLFFPPRCAPCKRHRPRLRYHAGSCGKKHKPEKFSDHQLEEEATSRRKRFLSERIRVPCGVSF